MNFDLKYLLNIKKNKVIILPIIRPVRAKKLPEIICNIDISVLTILVSIHFWPSICIFLEKKHTFISIIYFDFYMFH